jgi:cobalt transporter subunit CbtB
MESSNETKTVKTAVAGGRAAVVVPAALAAAIGLFVITMVGFAGSDVLHNAAHDTRHGAAFPCH